MDSQQAGERVNVDLSKLIPEKPSREEVGAVFAALKPLFEELSAADRIAFGALMFGEKPPMMRLKEAPIEEILKASERVTLEEIEKTEVNPTRAQSSAMVLVLKATRLCNLRCTYCRDWREGPGNVMSFMVLARTIRDALLAPGIRHVEFVWHGGEISMLKTSFFRKAPPRPRISPSSRPPLRWYRRDMPC